MLLCGAVAANADTKTIREQLVNPLNVDRSDVPVVVSLRDVQFNVADAVGREGGGGIP